MVKVLYTANGAPDLVKSHDNAGIDLFVTQESLKTISVDEEFSRSVSVSYLEDNGGVQIKVFEPVIIHVDLPYKFVFPEGVHGIIFGRSGNFFRNGIDVFKGVIDSSYRGPIKVGLIFYKRGIFTILPNTAIAQLVIINTNEYVRLKRISEEEFLKYTSLRGEKGFGSSGNNIQQ